VPAFLNGMFAPEIPTCPRPSSSTMHRLRHCPVQPEYRSPGKEVKNWRVYIWLRKKHFPTTAPMTDPMIAPAAKSENQWMVI
jgi:hypothetical protein